MLENSSASSLSNICDHRRRVSSYELGQHNQKALSKIATSLKLAPVPALAIAGFMPQRSFTGTRGSPLRSSYHGKPCEKPNPGLSSPNSIDRKRNLDVVGSAESLVGRVLYAQGLGKFIDPGFLRAAQRELAEAFSMTQDEIDRYVCRSQDLL